jgi:hypothetical protein
VVFPGWRACRGRSDAIAGQAPVKRNRFIQLDGGTTTINRELETKARDLAGIKGYVTNLAAFWLSAAAAPTWATA